MRSHVFFIAYIVGTILAIVLCMLIIRCIVNSDLPLWLKIALLR